jgi:hypothetical protein
VFGACAHDARVNRQAQTFKEFGTRVEKYTALHKRVEGTLPKLPTKAAPEAIEAHRSALSEAIRRERAAARRGDIFFDPAADAVRRIVRNELRGPGGEVVRRAVRDGNPQVEGKPIAVKVNGIYPTSAPVSTMPPSLLANLPKLPEELEYRFVGRHLILRDVGASLIVDFVWEAAPHL